MKGNAVASEGSMAEPLAFVRIYCTVAAWRVGSCWNSFLLGPRRSPGRLGDEKVEMRDLRAQSPEVLCIRSAPGGLGTVLVEAIRICYILFSIRAPEVRLRLRIHHSVIKQGENH